LCAPYINAIKYKGQKGVCKHHPCQNGIIRAFRAFCATSVPYVCSHIANAVIFIKILPNALIVHLIITQEYE